MKLNIQKLNFEKTQKQHDEMVEIFHQRMNEKTLTDDEFGPKRISLNRQQSSVQELSSKNIIQESSFRNKIPNISQTFDSKKRLQYCNEEAQFNAAISKIDEINLQIIAEVKNQNSMNISVQNDNKSSLYAENQDNKSVASSIQFLNSSGINSNFSPTFVNKKQIIQLPVHLEDKSIDEHQEENKQENNQILSKKQMNLEDLQQRGQSISPCIKKANEKDFDFKLFQDLGKGLPQNQSYISGVGMETSDRKQKQNQATQQNSRKKESRKFTEMLLKKQKKINFLHIILKMKNYALKMASNIQSKKLAVLQKQEFFYLRDKTINYDKQLKENYEFYDYNKVQKYVLLFFQFIQSISLTKRIHLRIPTIPLFQPQSIWKFVWDIFNMIIVIVFFFYLPLYFIYEIDFSDLFYIKQLDIFLVIIATLDIFVNLNTVQYRKGNLLNSRALILLEYFSKNGFLNISFVTILWIVIAQQRVQIELIQNYKFSVIFFSVALFKVFRQNSFKNRIYDRFYLRKINRGFISLMQIFFNLFIVSHLFACIWLVVGKMNQTEDSIQCAQQYEFDRIKTCTYTWLDKLNGIRNLAFYEQYLRAYYFTTVTMITVGYGDITPANSQEYLLSVLTMLIACGMFGYSLNSIGQILSEMDINNKEYDEHFNAIYGFMHKKKISTDLQVQVREYLQYFFIQSNQEDIQKQQKVISLLPDSLQNQIMLEANKIIFENSNLFKQLLSKLIQSLIIMCFYFSFLGEKKFNQFNLFFEYVNNRMNFSESIIQKTIKIIEQREYRPGQKIIVQDMENDNNIYFIEKGSVEVYNNNNNEQLKILHKGSQFGEIQFFTGQTSQVSIRSVEFTKLLAIKRNSFFELIQSSPQDLERFSMIKDSIMFSNKLETVGIYCYCCQSTNHLITQCNLVHLQQDKYKIIKEYVRNDFQVRDREVQRRTFSYDSLQIKDQIDECAKHYIEENIEELCQKGWFNDLIQLDYQNQLVQFKNSFVIPSRTSLKTINQQNNPHSFQNRAYSLQNQLSNIKINYQKVKNSTVNMPESQNMNTYYELNPFDKSSVHIKSNNNFQHAFSGYNDEYSQSFQAFNINKKVQFSINSLQENLNDENLATDNKSIQVQKCQSQQIINFNNNQIGVHNYLQNNGEQSNFNITPSNRQRQHSNYSEKQSSPKSTTNNNIFVNVNSANYYHQNNRQNSLTNQSNQGYQCHSPQAQTNNYCYNDYQKYTSIDSSRQITNQDTFSQVTYQNTNYENQHNGRNKSLSKSANQNDQQQKQKEQIFTRQNIKRNTMKSDIYNKKKSSTPKMLSKQFSSVCQKQTNEALIKQLKELVQIPQIFNTQQENLEFDILKNYQFYMPHNNYERVILNYTVFMRKIQANQSNQNTKKSSQNNKLISIVKSQMQNKNDDKKSIQFYTNLLKQNALESKLQSSHNEENNKNNTTQ